MKGLNQYPRMLTLVAIFEEKEGDDAEKEDEGQNLFITEMREPLESMIEESLGEPANLNDFNVTPVGFEVLEHDNKGRISLVCYSFFVNKKRARAPSILKRIRPLLSLALEIFLLKFSRFKR